MHRHVGLRVRVAARQHNTLATPDAVASSSVASSSMALDSAKVKWVSQNATSHVAVARIA
ncbi:unannotated protein [freshwater metagenome]|uniref:Unannotated protein n=1 Tax=freshwater metagenome TaxID=449393 RepID=A0A6J7MXB1_9ZZZZ